MKLALVGADDETLRLVRALVAGGHELTAVFDAGSYLAQLRQLAPAMRVDEDWEALLLGSQLDCAIVARGRADLSSATGISASERREEQLRKLAQSAVPALVAHPACEAIVGFEIEMIRRDCQGVLIPYMPGLLQPALQELAEMADFDEDSPLGTIEQIVFERYQADRGREAVLAQFARDAVLLRKVIGEIHKVSASGPPGSVQADPLGPKSKIKPNLSNLNVHLVGECDYAARWSVLPPAGEERGSVSWVGSRGRMSLEMPLAGSPWMLIAPQQELLQHGSFHADELVLWSQRLPAMLQGTIELPLSWIDACRASEAAAAIDRSLERGRTIEQFNEEHTEAESFKGVMAVGGCLLLAATLGVLFAAAVVEGLQLPLRSSPVWRLWPVFLLAPIGVFLLLQLLQVVIKRDSPERPRNSV